MCFYLLHFPTIVRFRLAAVRHTLTTAGMQSYTPLCQSIFSTSVMNPQRALSFSDIDCGSCYPVAVCFFTFARTGEPRAVECGGNTGRERAGGFSDFPTPPTTGGDTDVSGSIPRSTCVFYPPISQSLRRSTQFSLDFTSFATLAVLHL